VSYALNDGTEGRLIVPSSRGFGEHRLTGAEVLTKFSLNAAQALSPAALEELLALLPDLEAHPIGEVLGRLHEVAAR
jgi:hypothetical protein